MSKEKSPVRTCRPRDAMLLAKVCMKADRPLFLWGPPGVGKSDIIAQIAEQQGRSVIDMRLLLMDPTDLKGIPYFDSKECVMKWAPSSELPSVVSDKDLAKSQEVVQEMQDLVDHLQKQYDEAFKKGTADNLAELHSQLRESRQELDQLSKRAIRNGHAHSLQDAVLFLDEMNSAAPNVQGAAYQLVLNRRVGEYILPDTVSIIAAGNRDTDKGVTYRMPTPLANRFIHLELESNFEDWQKWAINAGVHEDVVGYLTSHTQDLYQFDPRTSEKAFATPRSWVFVSDLVHRSDLTPDMLAHLVAGTIGDGLAIKFDSHRKYAKDLPLPMDVLEGKAKKMTITETSARYSLTISCCYRLREMVKPMEDKNDPLTKDKWHGYIDNYLMYMMDNFQDEMVILGAKTALRDHGLPVVHRELKNFKAFYEKYGRFLLD